MLPAKKYYVIGFEKMSDFVHTIIKLFYVHGALEPGCNSNVLLHILQTLNSQ